MCSDGDLQEGVSAEASSIAGTQRLGNLTVIYDANRISIEGDTDVAFTEDVGARYEAYGWHVQTVDWTHDGTELHRGRPAAARRDPHGGGGHRPAQPHRPAHVIAWPAPNAQGTGATHGSALGAEEVAATKKIMGFDPEQHFEVPEAVIEQTRSLVARGKEAQAAWEEEFAAWRDAASADVLATWERMQTRALPDGLADALPTFDADEKGVATRKASGAVINAVASLMPELWGGSADLAESNNTTIKDAPSFIPKDRSTDEWTGDPEAGRVLHFGIREHGMGAILNGIALHGGTRVFGGTFLTFSDYMRGSVRLAALMGLPVTYVWTHDSIGLGEDGPTHQPIEHLAALRAIPGLDVVRPADANETAAAWQAILQHTDRPAGIALTRQNVPVFPRGTDGCERHQQRAPRRLRAPRRRGRPARRRPRRHRLRGPARRRGARAARRGRHPRPRRLDAVPGVVRRPGAVLPRDRHPAHGQGAGLGRGRHRASAGARSSATTAASSPSRHYGASADYARIYDEYGITAEAVAQAARDSIHAATD